MVFIQIQETGYFESLWCQNQFINEQNHGVLARSVNNILYLHKKCIEYIYLYQNCIKSTMPISSNIMWIIRNEADKAFVRTK